jgi:hypothetical protein
MSLQSDLTSWHWVDFFILQNDQRTHCFVVLLQIALQQELKELTPVLLTGYAVKYEIKPKEKELLHKKK